jgi:hypothetical protein
MILQPPATLLVGPTGTGKTAAIPTQLLAGLDVFAVVTEPGGVDSLLDSVTRLNAPIEKLHWTTCLPASSGWAGLEEMITKISTMDQKGLADVKDMGKADFRPAAMRFLNAFKNFHCERTNKDFGDFTTWDDTRGLSVDSLTGWSYISWGLTVGYKPTANPGEWGIGQNFIEKFLLKINNDRRCFFTLTSHLEKEMDDLTGVKRLMVSTIGAKLAPKIPTFFSEVVRTHKDVDAKGEAKFRWSTLASDVDLKNRALPISANLQPSFVQIVEAYNRRKKLASGPAAPTASPAIAAAQTGVPNVNV